MAATLPRPSLPSTGPPTTALPPLPSSRTRKSLGASSMKNSLSSPQSPTSALPIRPSSRTVSSASALPSRISTPPLNAPGVPTPQPISQRAESPKPGKRTVSVSAFPKPPKVSRSSLPSSPLSAGAYPTDGGSLDSISSLRSPSDHPSTPGGSKLKRSATNASKASYSSNTPSLLNGSGENKSISSGNGARGSDGLLSLPSPPQSRSSSAHGSYSTSATTLEDSGDYAPRGREGADGDSKGKESKGNVIVSVRVRPEGNGKEGRAENDWNIDGRRSLISYRGRDAGDYYYGRLLNTCWVHDLLTYLKDNVYAPLDKNAKVYDSAAKRLVRRVMEGYHGTVFAYGMTGTGKTFTMNGTATSPGIIPLSITDIFSYIRETPHREFLLRVSYLEIYNEKIYDLLSPQTGGAGGQQEEIKLREDSKRGVYATPLKEEIVQSPTQLLRVIARGDHSRRTGSTQYNARSSRSHAVVQIVVESRERLPGVGLIGENKRSGIAPGGVRVSTLSLIDLAGSERAAEDKERRTEGAHINKSLLTLGSVIAQLSGKKDKSGNPTNQEGKHLPYRDSKLTRLLQPALSGNSLISILCTIQTGAGGSVAAATSHIGETLNTLKFASRAKNNIVSHAKKAEEAIGSGNGDAGSRVLLERYRMEIVELRTQLEDQAKSKVEEVEKEREKEAEVRHEEQMLEMQLARTALKERIEHLNRLILCSKSTGVNSSGSFSSLGMNSRFSGMTNGHSSALSMRSSVAAANRPDSLARTASIGSVSTIGQLPNGNISPPEHVSDDDSLGEFGDGKASLTTQNRALQADLADKNRYISTLEKRLLQARRTSHSRMSIGLSPTKGPGMLSDEGNVAFILKEKDDEIAELRARLDDKDRMVTALRSAARKRDVADVLPDSPAPLPKDLPPLPVNPMTGGGPVGGLPLPPRGRKRTKSVDEMSKMLDEMIQDRVESGQLVKGARGSVRLAVERKRETGLGRHDFEKGKSTLSAVVEPVSDCQA
ncbi:MAG: hypothetical protein M1814_001070 [Vezdaea aestivalis]|nr:MAG: hypothetical protein M1814_001070 [Vezdaea aestivalis]